MARMGGRIVFINPWITMIIIVAVLLGGMTLVPVFAELLSPVSQALMEGR